MELGLPTLAEWKAQALEVLRNGEITSAATGGGVQYAKSRGLSIPRLLVAIKRAEQRLLQPEVVPTVGQCATVIFSRSIS